MTLRRTILFAVAVTFLGLVLLLLVNLRTILTSYFADAEALEVRTGLLRARAALDAELAGLGRTGREWASRREVSDFFSRAGTSAALEAAINRDVLSNLNVQAFLLANDSGEIVFRSYSELPRSIPLSIAAGLAGELQPLLAQQQGGKPFSHLWRALDYPVLVHIEPLSGAGGGQSGKLLLGRFLDEPQVARLAALSQAGLALIPVEDQSPEATSAVRGLAGAADYIHPQDETSVAGYTLLRGPQDCALYLLQITQPRTVYRSGQVVTNYLIIFLVASSLIFAVIIFILLEWAVLLRLTRLGREVQRIGQSGDLSRRVTVTRKDELSRLAQDINAMLGELEQAQKVQQENYEQIQSSRQRLEALSRRLVEVQEQERRWLAQELHDEIGQELTGLKLLLDTAAALPASQVQERSAQARQAVNELIGRVRQISLDLRPAMLDDLGLLPTLLWFFDRYTSQTRVQVRFYHSGLEGRRLPPAVETAAYRIIQEGLTNVARHAGVSEAGVQLLASPERLVIEVEDRGAGFDPQAVLQGRDSRGLAGMRERVSALGGELVVEASPGAGVSLAVEIPLAGKEGAGDGDHDLSGG